MSPGSSHHERSGAGAGLDDRRRAAALVYVADVDAPALDAVDEHHLRHVLRIGESETVVASDGRGAWRPCRLPAHAPPGPRGVATRRRRGDGPGSSGAAGSTVELLDPVGPVVRDGPSVRPVTVAFAVTKGDRPEWTVQKLTELGVDEIVPLLTMRTVVRLGPEEVQRRAARLRRVAREAGAQCRRTFLPDVAEPMPFERALERLPDSALLAEPGGGPLDPAATAVLVGPEGGWDPAELACGLGQLDLGPSVLRSDTAALVAAVLLGAARAGGLRRSAEE